MKRLVVAALLLALLPFPSSLADAGTPDAGGSLGDATPVAMGPVSGSFATLDDEDWYRVALPAGFGLDAVLRSPRGAELAFELYAPDGQLLRDTIVHDTVAGRERGYESTTLRAGSGGNDVVIRLAPSSRSSLPTFAYDLQLAPLAMPDLAITRLAVSSRPVETTLGDAPVAWAHRVEVVVENVGPVAGKGPASAVARVEGVEEAHEWLGFHEVDLAPGESVALSYSWNSSGWVGDVSIHARARASHDAGDLDPANGESVARFASYAGGSGHGATLTPGWTRCYASAGGPPELCEHGDSREDGLSLWRYAGVGDAHAKIEATVGLGGVDARACTNLVSASPCQTQWPFEPLP